MKSVMPVATVISAAGAAGAAGAGTACIDTVRFLACGGGQDAALAWEFAPVDRRDQAPDPAGTGRAFWPPARKRSR